MSDTHFPPTSFSWHYPDWREQYLGTALQTFARLSGSGSADERVPYGDWTHRRVDAPGHRLDDNGWMLERHRLRRHMESGGIAVIVGETGTGKTCLLENLPLEIIDNSAAARESGIVYPDSAPVSLGDIPPAGLFAIDDTAKHDVGHVLHVLNNPDIRKRGFALVFQSPHSFRNFQISMLLAERSVLILELVTRRLPA